MLLHAAMLAPSGPPPQRVLDNRILWYVLIVLLGMTTIMRFLTLDIIGGILSSLMLCMAGIILADGMQELPRYSLVFGMLCVLCLFFDTVPLLASLSGRTEVRIQPVQRMSSEHFTKITYTTTVRTTPFFDWPRGFMYNGASIAMLLSPLSMLLGAYLAIHAHIELHRSAQPFFLDREEPPWWRDDYAPHGEELERRPLLGRGSDGGGGGSGGSGSGSAGPEGGADGQGSGSGDLAAGGRPGGVHRTVSRFQGTAYRLDV